MAILVGVDGPFKGQQFKVEKTGTVGRSFDTDIRVDELSVSRRHARLIVSDSGVVVEDLGSGNGTFVNEEKVSGPRALKDGDVVRFANNSFKFSFDVPAAPAVKMVEPAGKPPVMETLDLKATMMNMVFSDKIQAPETVQKVHQRLRTVLEISNAVQTQLDMDKLLTEIMDRLFQVFSQADRGFILLKTDDGEGLVPRVARQRGKDRPDAITTSKTIIDHALNGKVGVLSADAGSDQRFSAAMSVMNFQIRSIMVAPLIANDEPLGVIHLDTMRQDRQFTRDDLDLLAAVATQTAFSVANAKMHRRIMAQQRTERDLQLARQVQESFLPTKPPEVNGFEFCAMYKSALEVGGDFYNFIPLSDNRLGMVVGDVAGKGIPAALVMAQMTSDTRYYATSDANPAAVVQKLNDAQCARNSDGFVTLIYGILDPATRVLTMVNAAHPAPVLRKGATGEVSDVQTNTNFPVGAVEGNEFAIETLQLDPGDVVCLFSDGITEAMNSKKELFGVERLHEAVAASPADARQVMENVLKAVQAFVGDAYQSDDLTLVCVAVK